MSQRGFTLVELMSVISITGIVAAATGLLYLEIRTAGVLTEAQVTMERRAALVLEWVARDLRTSVLLRTSTPKLASKSEPALQNELLRLESNNGTIIYKIEGDALLRYTHDGAGRVLTRYAESLVVVPVEGGHRATVRMKRTLRRGRWLKLRRETFVGRRR
ncbi:MAG: prepilin-type N-terminal cleavage/methylation domain-containing protein [Myxococcota bacterium]